MSTSSKSKVLVIAVIVLLLTNLGMLFFFLRQENEPAKKQSRGRDGMMTDFLQKEIGFNKDQLQQYDTLSKQHREKVKAAFDEIRSSKQEWYKQLGNKGFDDSTMHNTAVRTADMQEQIEYKMLLHFKEIRKICTPDQQPKFDSLFYKIWDKKSGDKKKGDNK